MKIAVLSDSHDHTALLRAAVQKALGAGVDAIIHCGDLVAVSTLEKVYDGEVPMHVIHGNNIGDPAALVRLARGAFAGVHYHGQDADLTLGGKRIFVVHYPHYANAMAATGDFDLVCHGHTHSHTLTWQRNLNNGQTPVLNPGTVGGIGTKPMFALVDLEPMSCEFVEVGEPLPRPA